MLTCIFEVRQSSCDHDKHNNSKRKDVHFGAVIWFALQHFRCLVLSGSHPGVVEDWLSIMIHLAPGTKTKVSNLKLVI